MRHAQGLGLALALASLALAADARGLAPLLTTLERRTNVSNGLQLLQALNDTAGTSQGEVLSLADDIWITDDDVRAFQPFLPINGGNRTLVLLGARQPSGGQTVLDFGGAVNLMYHPAGHTFVAYNLAIQGMAPASAGIAAGMGTQMVAGAVWPTTTGEPGHLMAFWNTTIRLVTPTCGLNSTNFTVSALREATGSASSVQLLDERTFFVGAPLNGSYAVRVLPSGASLGNVRTSWDNTTITCTRPAAAGNAPGPAQAPAALQANATASTAVAGSPGELLLLLSLPNVGRIILGASISLQPAQLGAFALPLDLSSRNVTIESNDEHVKVLDFGGVVSLLRLSADSILSFSRLHLQGAAPPSSAITSRATIVVGSPLWPTIDGEPGHQLRFFDCSVMEYVTPCSRNSTQITKDLLRKVLGNDAVQGVGDTGYLIVPRFQQTEPIRDILTEEQVGSTQYVFESTTRQCQEDPSMGLAAELQQQAAAEASAAGSGGGGMPAWLAAVVAVAAAGGVALLGGVGLVIWRRRRPAARLAPGAGGSLKGCDSLDDPKSLEAGLGKLSAGDMPGTSVGSLPPLNTRSGSHASSGSKPASEGSSHGGEGPGSATGLSLGAHRQEKLWRSRVGLIEGLEVAELLGRGAFGKVFKGRWNGCIVAVKVIEHRVSAEGPSCLSREPLLCMSVSHPNCITTYKLSVIRLLKGEDLQPAGASLGGLPPQEQLQQPAEQQQRQPEASQELGSASSTVECRLSSSTDDSAMLGPSEACPAGSGRRPLRLLRSLLTNSDAVEVEDACGPLQAGNYESWIVSEFCERGTLVDALEDGRLRLPDGRPHMVAIYLCLLDIASGMQYLHSLGIMHSDLKPANVLLKGARNATRGFTCKLADFGLSRMLDGRTTHVETGSYGTPTHAAPELLREGRLSPAVDVYAFGVLAWELVAGEEAFHDCHPMQIILQVTQHGMRPSPLPDCPPQLASLMQRCWADSPTDRPTFAELLPELQQQLTALRALNPGPPLPGRRPSFCGGPSSRPLSPQASDAPLPAADELAAAQAAP